MFLHLSVILFTRGGVWQTPPRQTPPWADTPLGRHLLGRHPTQRWPLQETVRILLECILVPLTVHTTQGQESYCTSPVPCPCLSPGPVQSVWARAISQNSEEYVCWLQVVVIFAHLLHAPRLCHPSCCWSYGVKTHGTLLLIYHTNSE